MRWKVPAALVLCALAVLLVAQTPQPQQSPPPFLTVSFYKVPGDKIAQYEEFVGSATRRVMQAVIDSGELRGWIATRVVSPAGSDAPYNFVSVSLWPGAPRLDIAPAETDKFYQKAGLTRAGYTDMMRTIGGSMVKREIWRGPITYAGEHAAVGDYLRIDYKYVPPGSDYPKPERDVYQPIWAARAKQGVIKGWAVYYVAQPGGMDRPVSFATVQSFKDEKQMFMGMQGAPSTADTFKEAHPGKDMDDVMKKASEASKTVRMDIARVRHVMLGPASGASGQH